MTAWSVYFRLVSAFFLFFLIFDFQWSFTNFAWNLTTLHSAIEVKAFITRCSTAFSRILVCFRFECEFLFILFFLLNSFCFLLLLFSSYLLFHKQMLYHSSGSFLSIILSLHLSSLLISELFRFLWNFWIECLRVCWFRLFIHSFFSHTAIVRSLLFVNIEWNELLVDFLLTSFSDLEISFFCEYDLLADTFFTFRSFSFNLFFG